jgi:hypothetical protein
MQSLRNIFKEVVKSIGIESAAALNVLRRKWPEIVGQPISVHTFPETVRNKILTIIVDTPQWIHHLSFFKKDIAEKLKAYDIRDVRFRVGRLPEKTVVHNRKEDASLTDDEQRFVENTVRNIKDEEIKEQFRKLIGHGLTKGKGFKK